MFEAEKFHEDLETLVKDYEVWATDRQQSDLEKLMEHLIHIENGLNTTLSDCVSLGRRYWKDHNLPVIDGLHRSHAIMDNVFNDLKRLRTALNEAYINPSDLEQLIIDWCRFKKSILQTREAMYHTRRRRKNNAWARDSWSEAQGVPQ